MATAVWAIRSATVATPSIRTPPVAFEIATALTGGGKYVPDDIRFQILYRLSFSFCAKSANDCRSTPAAPPFSLTFRSASQMSIFGISNDLPEDLVRTI